MSKLDLVVPFAFINPRFSLSWKECLFGYGEGYLSAKSVVSMAQAAVLSQDYLDSAILELAALKKGKSPRGLLEEAASLEADQSVDVTREKWLFILLSWLFEEKDKKRNPFLDLEYIYYQFDYPPCMKSFIESEPSRTSWMRTSKQNKQVLIKKWSEFLKENNKYSVALSKNSSGSEFEVV
ncbi:MAG: hypothetical protein CR997_00205 [Acidobacteria bacterium]|nr:MAG: hypothetical protein CR997_00205 [Acidobacteriota bacterium]